MSLFSWPDESECPPAYGDCSCSCHRIPGVYHCMSCCWPEMDHKLLNEPMCPSIDEQDSNPTPEDDDQ